MNQSFCKFFSLSLPLKILFCRSFVQLYIEVAQGYRHSDQWCRKKFRVVDQLLLHQWGPISWLYLHQSFLLILQKYTLSSMLVTSTKSNIWTGESIPPVKPECGTGFPCDTEVQKTTLTCQSPMWPRCRQQPEKVSKPITRRQISPVYKTTESSATHCPEED